MVCLHDCTSCFQEMDCLEDKLEELSKECRTAVEGVIEEEEEEPEVNEIFREECEPVIKKHCRVRADVN
jgi:hypothetical protein